MFFFFKAEDGIRDLVRSRGLGDVYKRQTKQSAKTYTVQYILKTSTAQNVRVVYNNATEGMERRENMSLSAFHPTEWSYQMEPGTHAYISVDTSQKTPQSVSVSCELLVNGVRKDYTEAKGPLASVTCSGIVGR